VPLPPRIRRAALEDVLRRDTVGILILTHDVAADIRAQVDAVRLTRDRPLIVEIPGPQGPLPGRKTLRQFVQEAVGIRVGQEEGT
jgi:V/A-type H+-transporting ATPase subunit F